MRFRKRRLYARLRRLFWPRTRREPSIQELLDRRHRLYDREREQRFAGYANAWLELGVGTKTAVLRPYFWQVKEEKHAG